MLSSNAVDRQIVASTETLQRGFRLDPSQYNERAERMSRHLRQLGIALPKLKDTSAFNEVYLPNRFSRNYLDSSTAGFPLLGTSTMLMTRLPVDSRVWIEEGIEQSRLAIQPGDILVSRSGTVGTSVLCGESYKGFIASDDCLRVRVDENLRGYLQAYLQSFIGHMLLTRDGHGKVIRHLKERDIELMTLPIIDSDKMEQINGLMLESTRLTDEARNCFHKMEEFFADVFASVIVQPNGELTNSESDSFLVASNFLFGSRLDPHFHIPRVATLRTRFASIPNKPLGAIADVWMPTRFARPRAEKGHGVPFYSSGDIMRVRRKPSAIVSRQAQRYLDLCVVESGTTLISRSGAFGGIMGRSMYVTEHMNGWAVSEHMVRCKVFDPDYAPEYIFAFLASMTYGYPLITSYRHGKDVPELDPDDLKSMPIPLLSEDDQDKVVQLVRKAFDCIDRANDLEDDAQALLLKELQLEGEETDEIGSGGVEEAEEEEQEEETLEPTVS